MVQKTRINIPTDDVADFCRRHHILELALFGSVLRDDFRPDSDIDVLVQYDPHHPVGFRIFEMEQELSRMFGGHKVDIVNEKYLNRRLRQSILRDTQVLYAKG